jgi:site-specific DNA-methyltransferase (adenine-specific)
MFKYEWVWNKKKGGNPLLSKKQPIKITENIVVFSEGRTNYYPQMTPREKPVRRGKNKGTKSATTNNAFTEDKEYTEYYPKNIIEISNASQINKLHPTQKPVALMEYLIKTYTNEEETVLDFTMGSGTTGVAAKKLNRNFIGIELDPEYFAIAEKRINETQIES